MAFSLTFLGASGTVTGSSYLISTSDTQFLVDCGFHQGAQNSREINAEPFTFDPAQVNFLILTHAHLDHCGLIPKLYRAGFRGTIYATPATFELVKLILADAAQIQENGVSEDQLDILFNTADALGSFTLFKTIPYNKVFKPTPAISAQFRDAGHILGSAMVELWAESKKIVFSGDIGNCPVPIMHSPTAITEADYVLCESTYGDRLHSSGSKREQELLKIIRHAKKHHSKVIIPSFALERTQDLLYTLNNLKNSNQLPEIPVVLDSPLAIRITNVFRKFTALFDAEFQALLERDQDLFTFPGFRSTITSAESKLLNDQPGAAVYMAGSGMADAGRVQHHLLHHLGNPDTQVVFVGFQAPGTLGRKLVDGIKRVSIGEYRVGVRAAIHTIDSFSAHADQKGLMGWLKNFTTHPQLFLVHGEDPARKTLAALASAKLGLAVTLPKRGQTIRLT